LRYWLTNTLSPTISGVTIFMPRKLGTSCVQSTAPESASTPASTLRVKTTTWRTPAIVAIAGEENAPSVMMSVRPASARQRMVPSAGSIFSSELTPCT